MPIHLCVECGTSYAEAARPPNRCPICEDERQYVPRTGQAWTTLDALRRDHVNSWRMLEPGLLEIHTKPDFAIAQRAMLVRTPSGNVLWDCVALIDEATIELIRGLGGLAGIAISHPHYYTTCQDWATAFDCPVYLHSADREWLMRPHPAVVWWDGETLELSSHATLIRLGGHFDGSTVLRWSPARDGKAVLLTGDTIQLLPDPNRVTFLWSYPNKIPLSARTVRRIGDAIGRWRVDRAYGFEPGLRIETDASAAIEHSVERYVDLLSEDR